MSEFTIVTRDLDLDVPAEELWDLIGSCDGWREWIADEAEVDVSPGGGGEVVDRGEQRQVEITSVQPGESVGFVWWPDGRDDLASSVSLTIDADDEGCAVLRVVEVFPPESDVDPLSASLAWDVRAVSAWLCGIAPRCRAALAPM